MSWFRVYSLVGILAILGSCGFRPLYVGSENQFIHQQLAHIQISSIENRLGQQVQNLLLDRLNSRGRPDKPLYTLNVRIEVSTEEIGLKFTEEATRAKLTLRAIFSLIDNSSGKTLTAGEVRSVNSYNMSDSEFARLASELDAKKRAAREISDEIKTRLSLYFSHLST
jgi:hypothetical protein